MQKPFYDTLARPFETDTQRRKRLIITNRIITRAFFLAYPAMLAVLIFLRDPRLLRVVLVPVISFLAVTLFREICNARRPYEIWHTTPLIPQKKKGHSFPSRHIFSVFIIAMSMSYICMPIAIPMFIAGACLGLIRISARVHFVRDVAAGAGIAILIGLIAFWLV